MTRPLTIHEAFQRLGYTQESLTDLGFFAADADDDELCRAIRDAQLAVLRAGNRIVALRATEAAA